MYRSILIQAIGIIGALASIIALIDTKYPSFIPGTWLNYPLNIPTYIIAVLFFVISILLVISGRLLFSHIYHHAIPSDGHSVMQYMVNNKLINNATNLDLCHYTAETIIAPWRAILEERHGKIDIRMMVRRPETDPNKHRVAEGCLDTVKEISEINPNLCLDVRFYNSDPLFRYQMFYNKQMSICIAGIYRYDPTHKMRFIGAEKNTMLILKKNRRREKLVIESIHSRFQYLWDQMSPLRAVIFDMDGVLVNSMRYHFISWKEAFIEAKVQFDENEFRKDIYHLEGKRGDATVRELYRKYMNKTPDENLLQEIVNTKRKIFLEFSTQIKPFDGVYEVLDYLCSCGVPLAVVTGSTQKSAEMTINRLFPNIFKIIISGSDVEKGKPDALPFSTAVQKLNIGNADQCLAVENAPLGVQSANSANIPVYCLLLDSPLEPRHLEECGALKVFPSHFKLLEGIKSTTFCGLRGRAHRDRDTHR